LGRTADECRRLRRQPRHCAGCWMLSNDDDVSQSSQLRAAATTELQVNATELSDEPPPWLALVWVVVPPTWLWLSVWLWVAGKTMRAWMALRCLAAPARSVRQDDTPADALSAQPRQATFEDAAELAALRARLSFTRAGDAAPPMLPTPGESEEATLRRFLAAAGGGIDAAAAALRRHAAWRAHMVATVFSATPRQILGCDPARVQAAMPRAVRSDAARRVVAVFHHFGRQCVVRSVLHEAGSGSPTSVERLAAWYAAGQEEATCALAAVGATQWLVVVDASRFERAQLDEDAFSFLELAARIDHEHCARTRLPHHTLRWPRAACAGPG
jgi:hypothetical protein